MHHALGTSLLLLLVFAGLPLLILFWQCSGASEMHITLVGDRRHFYDLLQQRGWSARPIALGSYLATAALVVLGLWCDRLNPTLAL